MYVLTHMTRMIDLYAVYVETLRSDIECSLEKDLNEMVFMNPSMVLYLTRDKLTDDP